MSLEDVSTALNQTNMAYTLIACEVDMVPGGLPLRGAQWGDCKMLYFGITEKIGDQDGVNIGMADRLLAELADSRVAAEKIDENKAANGMDQAQSLLAALATDEELQLMDQVHHTVLHRCHVHHTVLHSVYLWNCS